MDQRDGTQALSGLETLLEEVKSRGIQLRVEGERLRFSAPHGALTPELRELLHAHKPELIDLLSQPRMYPASFVQRRFWTLQQLDPGEAFYNVPFVFKLRGPLDPELLRQSFNTIVSRHDSLRTTLRETGGELMQIVAPQGEVQLTRIELGPTSPGERSDAMHGVLLREMQRPFDLARETGLRVVLLRTDRDEYILQLCLHNTLFDQNSLLILIKELSQHYAAFLEGGAAASLPAPAQYCEYVQWQESLLSTGMEERQNYWREWFRRGDPPPWTWRPRKEPPQKPGFHSHVTWRRLPVELSKEIRALSQRNGVTPYITLTTAYAMILRRYTGCADITAGTTYSNRHHWKFSSLIGATIDVPALRIDMTDNPTLDVLLGRVRDVVGSALTYQDVPFDKVLTGRSSRPLFRAVFSFFPETPHGRLHLPGVEVTYLEELINELSRPDLYLVVCESQTEAGEAFTAYWMHKQDVFTPETAAGMDAGFEPLLAAMISGPTQRVDALLHLD